MMIGVSELFIFTFLLPVLASVLAGTVFLVRTRGQLPRAARVPDAPPGTRFPRPDWQYAVVCGAVAFFAMVTSPFIEALFGKEWAFIWETFIPMGCVFAAIGFLGSWGFRRSSVVPITYSRWAGPLAAALILGAFCAPCLILFGKVPASREQGRRERAEQFAVTHPVAKLLIEGMGEADFKSQVPQAQLQVSDSAASFGHQQYQNESLVYEFLDQKLMAVTWREITTNDAYSQELLEITEALGRPDRIPISSDLVEQGAREVLCWNSPDADLEIERLLGEG
jgi:hypothetical protein